MPGPHITHNPRPVPAEHGTICALPSEFFGYFGWPSVVRCRNGDLIVVASGLRHDHVDPFGRTVLLRSQDEGRTWTTPTVINDLPIDDRDAGIVALGDGTLLVTWFTSDTRQFDIASRYRQLPDPEAVARYEAGFRRMTPAAVDRWLGSWTRLSEDGGDTWGPPVRVPVTAPHGPIVTADGALFYLGKRFTHKREQPIEAWRSSDRGQTWTHLGTVPLAPGTADENYHEPHVVEQPGGRLLGLIRIEDHGTAPPLAAAGIPVFSMMQTTSEDGGRTWSTAQPLGFHGSPPHLLRHSSGALICAYGHRQPPFGQRAMVSHDDGANWETGMILRDDGPDGDLGYPASVELPDGSLFTIYYQKRATGEPCSLLWTRWQLPLM